MKTKILSLIAFVMLFSIACIAGNVKTEKIKVKGNCGMCETRIEKAATSVNGVSSAEWDSAKQLLVVKYDESKTSSDAIQKAVAAVGHDTELYKAEDKVYNKLPGCCKYHRD